jgi:hypothetical protein
MPIPVIVSAAVPVFFTVTVWDGLVVLTDWLAKVSDVGLAVTAGVTPVPVSATDCGLLAALSEIEIVALRAPVAAGLKLAVMVQLAPAASELVLPGQVLVWEKSPGLAPLKPMLLIVSGPVPLFVRVTD